MPGCQKSMLSGDVADLSEVGTSCATSACDSKLKQYRTGSLLTRAECGRGGAVSARGVEMVAEAVLS